MNAKEARKLAESKKEKVIESFLQFALDHIEYKAKEGKVKTDLGIDFGSSLLVRLEIKERLKNLGYKTKILKNGSFHISWE
jgi:hypothetical protein